jgi:putative FmdB family regulatory protein
MALYEYRCRTCDTTFELRRPMAEANAPASCPDGHPGALRLLSVFASVGTETAGVRSADHASAAPCGAHCACHPG